MSLVRIENTASRDIHLAWLAASSGAISTLKVPQKGAVKIEKAKLEEMVGRNAVIKHFFETGVLRAVDMVAIPTMVTIPPPAAPARLSKQKRKR